MLLRAATVVQQLFYVLLHDLLDLWSLLKCALAVPRMSLCGVSTCRRRSWKWLAAVQEASGDRVELAWLSWWRGCRHYRQAAVFNCFVFVRNYTAFRKKHPFTFSFIPPWKMFRFRPTQNFQGVFTVCEELGIPSKSKLKIHCVQIFIFYRCSVKCIIHEHVNMTSELRHW